MFSQSLEHNRCYQDASPSLSFYFNYHGHRVTPTSVCRTALHSPAARVSRPEAEGFVVTRSQVVLENCGPKDYAGESLVCGMWSCVRQSVTWTDQSRAASAIKTLRHQVSDTDPSNQKGSESHDAPAFVTQRKKRVNSNPSQKVHSILECTFFERTG